VPAADLQRLEQLPWQSQLDEWESLGVQLLVVRRGDSRHPVIFVERAGMRYAIKETTPRMAEREIRNLQIVQQRGIPTLSPSGTVLVKAPPIVVEIPGIAGMRDYISGDRGYTITHLAPRVVPHILLYRLALTKRIKQRMLDAVAALMVNMHEHGIYWGDPSLANALLRVDGQSITAIMADAETAEIFPTALSEGLREQDLAQFGESLAWQAEDLRIAKGLPEDTMVLDDADYQYFYGRYRVIRRERTIAEKQHTINLYELYTPAGFLQTFNDIGSPLIDGASTAARQLLRRPAWYQRRIYEMLQVSIPRPDARRFYNLISGHRDIMSKNEEREVSIEEAAHDWYTHYHLPAILLLKQQLTNQQDVMRSYFEIMQRKWDMSTKAGYEIPLTEAIDDWAHHHTHRRLKLLDRMNFTGAPGQQHRTVADEAEQPPAEQSIESAELEPLLSTEERPLIHLDQQQLAEKLPEILHDTSPDD
jgi:Lipopolysaccharide kinase (Kdo/WaaP) family.